MHWVTSAANIDPGTFVALRVFISSANSLLLLESCRWDQSEATMPTLIISSPDHHDLALDIHQACLRK